MKIVFLGTPMFAVPSLTVLHEKYGVSAVVCQPDREKDRKGRLIEGAVKAKANELGLPVFQFEKIKCDGVEILKGLQPDIMVTCAYGQILSQEILDIPPLGVINVHGSLLPAYRGSAPIQRALINGESKTGITIMKTDAGMDSGAVLSSESVEIRSDDYVDGLYDRLSLVGARLLCETLDRYIAGKIRPVPQDEKKVTYAPMLKKEEAFIDFDRSAEEIRNLIRGFGYGICGLSGQALKIYRADLADGKGCPGEILSASKGILVVACKKGALRLTELQLSGKKRMTASDFLNGVRLSVGDRLSALDKTAI